ncbi:MAG TPA: Fe-S cluster assembly scaffold protein NifU [Syntrophorhabdus sp.]|jgi:nitrogen fixation NifU-like protein|nr:Fe-S cluster assembly scaffold protein NifU [Syntrophorhabdus sp.]MDI9557677.1 Fe-S cluster assembly scaffold protein NifU [Pseudomonadota bacterium]OPX93844.1 MAG: NifU-like protein [Syntrophorhabdus sp. PtaB.Bin027]OQB77910.1 MAG: NifU-like protein [Deltaproteobacteria bacterium ADurb.Bin135]MBP8744399.1 Fe-S cluster assembly scaffold protein NifU [Syntrophorhabdus sp.]
MAKGPYNEIVMDHFMNPRNVGEIEDANAVGEAGSGQCGDSMTLYLKIEDDKIQDAKFMTFGCGAAIASSSMMTELLKGRSIDDALNLTNSEVLKALGGLPEAKIHCSIMAEEAVRSAIEDYRKRKGV